MEPSTTLPSKLFLNLLSNMSEESKTVDPLALEERPEPGQSRRISGKPARKQSKKKKATESEIEAEIPIEDFDENSADTTDTARSNDVDSEVSEKPDTELSSSDSEGKKPSIKRTRGRSRAPKNKSDDPRQADSAPSNPPEKTIELVIESPEQEEVKTASRESKRNNGRQSRQERPARSETSRPRVDPDKVAKNAWKIYLAEVGEEGVALISDNDARELSRRCFRLASIFLEEEGRRS